MMSLNQYDPSDGNEIHEPSCGPPTKKPRRSRKEYRITNRSCEIVVNSLTEVIKKFENSCKVAVNVVKTNPRTKFKTHFCVTAVSKFMDRLHSLDFSSRIIFLNDTGNANRFNCSVFVLTIDSHVGALPFAFFITSHKSCSLLEPTFNALSDIMPSNAFNTSPLPKVMITGIEPAEHTAVSRCFPSVKAYISTFHLLRDVWRFIWDPENGIAPTDRSALHKSFRRIVLSESEEQFNCNVWLCNENATCKKYPEFLKYFKHLLKRKDLWGLDFRIRKNISYNKNILISEMHVLKENILHNSRTSSVAELFEFFCTVFCDYYVNKIEEAINGNLTSLHESRYMPDCKEEFDDFHVDISCREEIIVINTKKKCEFYVNRELGTCTCLLGRHGTPCIHQAVIARKLNSKLFIVASIDDEEKVKYRYLATGSTDALESENIVADVTYENDPSERFINETDCVTEYVTVTPADEECDFGGARENHTVDDCVNAIKTFWSKLSPFANKYPNRIYQWMARMSRKLDEANSIDDVIAALNGDSRNSTTNFV